MILPFLAFFASLYAGFLLGYYQSVLSFLYVLVLSFALGVAFYFGWAFARAPFAVIDDHENRLTEAEKGIVRLLEPAEYLTAQLLKCQDQLQSASRDLEEAVSLRDKYSKERADWAEPESKARHQKNHIADWVIVLGIAVEIAGKYTITEGEPYIEFMISIFNGTLFQVILEERPKGHIIYNDEQLDGSVEVQFGPFITPGTTGTFRLTQRLTKADAKLLQIDFSSRKGSLRFRFDKLRLSIADHADQNTLKPGVLAFSASRELQLSLSEVWQSSKVYCERIQHLLTAGNI